MTDFKYFQIGYRKYHVVIGTTCIGTVYPLASMWIGYRPDGESTGTDYTRKNVATKLLEMWQKERGE